LGWLNTYDGCYYRWIPAPPPGSPVFASTGGAISGEGSYYLRTCVGFVGKGSGAAAMVQAVVWLATPPAGFGGPRPGPVVLAQRALALLRLAGPQIRMSPSTGSEQLVGFPTWMWTAVSRTTWLRHSATAAVPGQSVTATAKAVSIRWVMGDGGAVVCRGPGTPYSSRYDPHASSPTCGYSYGQPSPSGGTFLVTATTTWRVDWVGAGGRGGLTVTRSSSVRVRVVEAEAVNR